MRTAFAMRIDKDRIMEESLDVDYFNNLQRHDKLNKLVKVVADLENEFKQMAGKGLSLAEMMKDPKCGAVLTELRKEKKKLQKLQYAISDAGNLEEE